MKFYVIDRANLYFILLLFFVSKGCKQNETTICLGYKMVFLCFIRYTLKFQ